MSRVSLLFYICSGVNVKRARDLHETSNEDADFTILYSKYSLTFFENELIIINQHMDVDLIFGVFLTIFPLSFLRGWTADVFLYSRSIKDLQL